MKIENMLSQLFDYQKFEENKALSQIIAQCDEVKGQGNPSVIELSFEQLDLVNAAGTNDVKVNLESLGIKKPDL